MEKKFRFWDEEENKFHYGDLYDLKYGYLEFEVLLPEQPATQFIGRKDIHGVDIYEGDIVKWGHMEHGKEDPIRVAEVRLDPDIQFVIINRLKGFFWGNPKIFHFGSFAYTDTEKYLEIIGNIHQNPELLTSNPSNQNG